MLLTWLKIPPVDYLPPEGVRLPNRLLPFLWFFLRQVRGPMAFVLVCFTLQGVFWASAPYFLKLFIDILDSTSDPQQLWDRLLPVFVLFVVVVLLLQPLVNQLGQWVKFRIIAPFADMIRRQLALYMQGHSSRYYQDDFAGRLASKVVETPFAIYGVIDIVMGPFLIMAVIFGTFMVMFATAHIYLLLIMIAWLAGYLLWMKYNLPHILSKSKDASDTRSIVRGRYVDTLTNIQQVKLFARNRYEDQYLLESLKANADKHWILFARVFLLNNGLQVLNPIFWLSVLLTSFSLWQAGDITTGDMAMIFPMLINMRNLTWWVSDSAAMFFQNLGQVEEGMETICKAQDVQDKPGAPDAVITNGKIDVRDLTFAYDKSKVFSHLDIDIPAGQKIGLVGPSGAGKSSLVQLLLRLYDIDGGQILIDGQNIADVTQDSLRSQIAVIPQISDLMHRSIRDNIRYGCPDATEAQIVEAARRARADDFILELTDSDGRAGYDAHVGERGVKLSGGQRQRIAIARAILKDAPILILDEATSALDSESEKLIQESLKGLMEGKTVIAIAHRLSTIAHLDRLIVMEDGKIVEDGPHKELLKQKGLYAKLWEMQSGGFIGG
ncbi:MAG: ABC transporter ATP-binding protein [Rhodospirillales bacterium]|nr:ABC transporter ATP-binding protein [Rhodospirillales bacterium]